MNDVDTLVVPVYLNQRVVFDLVATMQDGIAAVTRITESQSVSGESALEASANFGLSKVLASLLRIDFSGKVGGKLGGEVNATRNEDRIHTPASLFMHLRSLLRSKNWLQPDSSSLKPKPGDIIEFSARMQQNPLTKMVDTFLEVMEMHQAFAGHATKPKGGPQTPDLSKMKKPFQTMSAALKSGTTADLTTGDLACGYRSIVTLEKQYLNDQSMSDLVDGTFRVAAKVTRVVCEGKDSISLNRNTAIGCLPDSVLHKLQQGISNGELNEMQLPPFEWRICGPVIQVLPIAIFA